MMSEDFDKFKHGWANGSMKCRKCGKVFLNVRFKYSCHDKVEGDWPECCGELAKFEADWKEEEKVNRPHPYYLPETPEEDSLYCSTLSTREEELFNLLIANFLYPYIDTILDCDYIHPYVLTKRYVKRVCEKLTFKLSEKDQAKASFLVFETMQQIRKLRANFCTSSTNEVI
jgi:hypothetical protein